MASRSAEPLNLLATGQEMPVREPLLRQESADESLVSAARGGDGSAFGTLYERYSRMVHGVLLARVPVDAVDDLVQDVFIRALRRLPLLRKSGSFGAWLAAIARNLAVDYYRRPAAAEEQLPEDQQMEDQQTEDPPGGQIARRLGQSHEADANLILDAIRSLPDAYRETLILRLVEGMTGPEIAERTGLTYGSVRVNLHRGMQQLRALLSPGKDASAATPGDTEL